MRKHLPLLLCSCAIGLIGGYTGKRLVTGSEGNPEGTGTSYPTQKDPQSPGLQKTGNLPPPPRESLEAIKAAQSPGLYARVALWLNGAEVEEIAELWNYLGKQENGNGDISELLFLLWTLKDQPGALSAVAGTADEHYAWWAWACHAPEASLAAAIANGESASEHVVRGLADFHSGWLRRHYEDLPENLRSIAFTSLAAREERTDPLETLDFLSKHNTFNSQTFRALIGNDPWAAYDWLRENEFRDQYLSRYHQEGGASTPGDMVASFVETLLVQDPETLAKIASQVPSGEMRRTMENALFSKLLAEDPDAAITMAKENKSPYVTAQQLAKAGLHFLSTDPDRAFELAGTMLSSYGDALKPYTRVKHDTMTMFSFMGGRGEEATQLIDALIAKDPRRLVESNLANDEMMHSGGSPFSQVAMKWAEADLTGYSAWTNSLTDPFQRDPAAGVMMTRMIQDKNFEDAGAWLTSTSPSYRDNQLPSLISSWGYENPEAAAAWLDAADIPEDTATNLKSIYLKPRTR